MASLGCQKSVTMLVLKQLDWAVGTHASSRANDRANPLVSEGSHQPPERVRSQEVRHRFVKILADSYNRSRVGSE
jgi:hypothetical protein